VRTLLLEPGFDGGPAGRCPTCGLIVLEPAQACPADGSELEQVPHLAEAAVESALAQDAELIVVRHQPDLGAIGGIAALLRF
jgi:peptide subunit release factor 1 (eRF1)